MVKEANVPSVVSLLMKDIKLKLSPYSGDCTCLQMSTTTTTVHGEVVIPITFFQIFFKSPKECTLQHEAEQSHKQLEGLNQVKRAVQNGNKMGQTEKWERT